MADYVSALNGQQMDAALTEVALYNPEAWAVGQRNGVPVTSADETYHNNAKYYAQVAQSAIPGTYTAAVRWDIAQGLAGEAQEQARANISAGASNRNLLDNPFFTVNQRGASGSVASGGYAADRWFVGGASTVTRNADGTITLNGTSSYASLTQRLEESLINFLVGKTVTMSLLYSDGTVFSGTVYAYANRENVVYINGTTNFFVLDTRASRRWYIYLNGLKKTLTAVKLELGSYSTLANDVPQNDELECLKYQELIQNVAYNYIPIGFGAFAGGNTIRMFIPTSVPMNATSLHASVPITGSASVAGNGTTISVASITLVGVLRTGVYVNVNLNSAPTTGHTYSLMLGDGASILIDCNL